MRTNIIKKTLALLVLSLGLTAANSSMAITIDFEGLTNTSGAFYATTITDSGVTFSSTGTGGLGTYDLSNSGLSIIGLDGSGGGSFAPVRADIAGGATAVSVLLGDASGDADGILLQAFDLADNLLDSDSININAGFVTVSVTVGSIAYVTWQSSGSFPHSVIADEFNYTAAVPAPAALLILGLGLLLMRVRRS